MVKPLQHDEEFEPLLEQDRQWLAAELHDGLLQEVAGAQMRLESLVRTGKIPKGPVEDAMLQAIQSLRNATQEARRVVRGLQPPLLADKGLVGAIKTLLAQDARSSLKIRVKFDVAFRRLDPGLETGIYRIVQEALTNVKRHSQAERAEVRIAQIGDRLEIIVRDSGIGFDPARVDGSSLGLRGIRERARLLGGSARVDSQPGKGTRIAVTLPLSRPRE